MASAAPSRQQPRAACECTGKKELMGRRWSPASLDYSPATHVYQADLCRPSVSPWAHTRSIHLGSPPGGLFRPSLSRCRHRALDRLGDLLQTLGKRWNINSDPGFSDFKAHVPDHCIAWHLVTHSPPAVGSSEKGGKRSVIPEPASVAASFH